MKVLSKWVIYLKKINDLVVHHSSKWCKHSSENSWSYPLTSTQQVKKRPNYSWNYNLTMWVRQWPWLRKKKNKYLENNEATLFQFALGVAYHLNSKNPTYAEPGLKPELTLDFSSQSLNQREPWIGHDNVTILSSSLLFPLYR